MSLFSLLRDAKPPQTRWHSRCPSAGRGPSTPTWGRQQARCRAHKGEFSTAAGVSTGHWAHDSKFSIAADGSQTRTFLRYKLLSRSALLDKLLSRSALLEKLLSRCLVLSMSVSPGVTRPSKWRWSHPAEVPAGVTAGMNTVVDVARPTFGRQGARRLGGACRPGTGQERGSWMVYWLIL